MNYYELNYLLADFKTKLSGCCFEQAITPFKNQLELYINGDGESFRLVFNATPGNTALFIDSYRPPKKINTHKFFESLNNLQINNIILERNERLMSFVFDEGYQLWFKLYGSKANVLLTKDAAVVEMFKDRDKIGDPSPVIKVPTLLCEHSLKELRLESRMQALLPILPKKWINKLDKEHSFFTMSNAELIAFAKHLDAELRQNAEFRILQSGDTTLIPHHLLPEPTEKKLQSINELILYSFKSYAQHQRVHSHKNGIVRTLHRQIKRIKSALNNLNKADKGLEKRALYEKYGHLLMVNAHVSTKREKVIELDDLYEIDKKISIPLNQELSLAENAQKYYVKASNSLKSYEHALTKIPLLESKLKIYELLVDEVELINEFNTLKQWEKTNQKHLKELRRYSESEIEPTSAFYVLEFEGYFLWIGKNARSNDEIVKQSHKEDMWLHARGIPGSHVVIRMNNTKKEPELTFINQVASFAAYQSKAKGSNLVPVIYTKRKYVRKPKGSPFGAVTVQKEKVVIVHPKNPFK